ncbi:MAG: hypothetical protein HOK62_06190 [Verrucomicrobiales bacterium]|jgi:hypothetical protein|nr:hypothetical protein [Verrucomicrobiales bacterium]
MVREQCGSALLGMQPCDRKKFLQAVHRKLTQKIKPKKDFAQDTIHRYGDRPFALAIPRKE